jgi:hypothetical protein
VQNPKQQALMMSPSKSLLVHELDEEANLLERDHDLQQLLSHFPDKSSAPLHYNFSRGGPMVEECLSPIENS